jgi:hypothetical protein
MTKRCSKFLVFSSLLIAPRLFSETQEGGATDQVIAATVQEAADTDSTVMRSLAAIPCEEILGIASCADEAVKPLLEGVLAQVLAQTGKSKPSSITLTSSQVKLGLEALFEGWGQTVEITEKRAELIVAVLHDIINKK